MLIQGFCGSKFTMTRRRTGGGVGSGGEQPISGDWGRRAEKQMKFNIPGVKALCLQRTKENSPNGAG